MKNSTLTRGIQVPCIPTEKRPAKSWTVPLLAFAVKVPELQQVEGWSDDDRANFENEWEERVGRAMREDCIPTPDEKGVEELTLELGEGTAAEIEARWDGMNGVEQENHRTAIFGDVGKIRKALSNWKPRPATKGKADPVSAIGKMLDKGRVDKATLAKMLADRGIDLSPYTR